MGRIFAWFKGLLLVELLQGHGLTFKVPVAAEIR